MGPVQEKIVAAKAEVVHRALAAIGTLPLASLDGFLEDARMVAAGESYLRRSLEALLDLGRHILAKGFFDPVAEYREICRRLGERDVLEPPHAELLIQMARYRNRLTHFYDEITPAELYGILTERLHDIEIALEDILVWLRAHPELVARSL
jgi:uncharacterized protein YutE (UPF0331/DUF86 family)